MYVCFDTNQTIATTNIAGSGVNQNFSGLRTLRSTGGGRDGQSYTFYDSSTFLKSEDLGIVVGTGSTAVTPTDFQLATRIADGTAAGELEYFPSSGTDPTYSSNTGTFVLERLVRNTSGGTITVNEMGVYALFHQGTSSVCIIRDLVSPGFALTNGQYGRLTYSLSITS